MTIASPKSPSLWTLPNQLTLSRLPLSVLLFVFIELEMWIACIIVFAVAAVTDWLDGYFARKQKLVSSLGRMLDPLVDKIMIGGAFIFLLTHENTGIYAWMVAIIIGREILITGIRGYMEEQGIAFGADWLGKIKMTLQCIVLLVIFAVFAAKDVPNIDIAFLIRDVLIWTTVIVTAWSGLQYIYKAMLALKIRE